MVSTLQEEANVLQEYFNQAAFGKPIEPVLAALLPNLGRYVAERSYGARYQRSIYVKRAFDQAATIGANAANHVYFKVNNNIERPFWDRPPLAGIGELIEGSLDAKLPTIWRDGNGTAKKKLGRGESQKGETRTWRKSEGRR